MFTSAYIHIKSICYSNKTREDREIDSDRDRGGLGESAGVI